MDDRKLLEMAAKAAGLTVLTWNTKIPALLLVGPVAWNPLTDDGDALRLAVNLNMHIMRFGDMTTVRLMGSDWCCDERDDGNANAATRRAIVRAAAEIGKAMP